MTLLTIHDDVGIVHIDVEGHAGFNPGNDVVCASISTLVYTMVNILQDMHEREQIEELTIVEEPGNFHIRFKKDNQYKYQWNATRDFFLTGMEMIEEYYPEYLEVNA